MAPMNCKFHSHCLWFWSTHYKQCHTFAYGGFSSFIEMETFVVEKYVECGIILNDILLLMFSAHAIKINTASVLFLYMDLLQK